MRIILISGKAGSGKDEVAKHIKKNLPHTIITNLSKYIKMYVKELTDWNGDEETKPRTALQTMGDHLRAVDENYLTKRLADDIIIYKSHGIENVIISDVRLLNEINYFKNNFKNDVITIRITSPSSKRRLTTTEQHHHTETELDNYTHYDFIIKNNFDNSLENEINKILRGMK